MGGLIQFNFKEVLGLGGGMGSKCHFLIRYIIYQSGEESAFVLIKYGEFIDALGIAIVFSSTG